MGMKNYFKKKRFNAATKCFEISKFPDAKVFCKRNKVYAIIPIRFENGKPKYKLKLTIDSVGLYKCYIIEPKIYFGDGNPPHIYLLDSKINKEEQFFDELRICLHLPGSNEYKSELSILETVISWAIKWTEFYEIWLLTGHWYGGGKHAENDIEKLKKTREVEK